MEKKIITTEQILKAKILIIDDESPNVMVLEETLKQGGHTSIKSITDPIKIKQFFETIDRTLGETPLELLKREIRMKISRRIILSFLMFGFIIYVISLIGVKVIKPRLEEMGNFNDRDLYPIQTLESKLVGAVKIPMYFRYVGRSIFNILNPSSFFDFHKFDYL